MRLSSLELHYRHCALRTAIATAIATAALAALVVLIHWSGIGHRDMLEFTLVVVRVYLSSLELH